MRTEQAMVRQFITEVKQNRIPMSPQVPDNVPLCMELITEETTELYSALTEGDLVKMADGLADLLYVTLYTAVMSGIEIEPIFREVHRSNMTKKGGTKSPTGKQLKPKGYEPPNIEAIITHQTNDFVLLQPIAFYEDGRVQAFVDAEGRIFQR